MWYWKPEQPPPTTATRRATGTGVCMDMISFTFTAAVGVRLIISFKSSTRGILHEDSYVLSIAQARMAQTRVSNGAGSVAKPPIRCRKVENSDQITGGKKSLIRRASTSCASSLNIDAL